MIHKNVKIKGKSIIQKNVEIGMPSLKYLALPQEKWPRTEIDKNAVIRLGAIIYCAVKIGHNFQSGHNILIRENTIIGNNVLIGTNSMIEGRTKIGNNVRIQSMVYIPTNCIIEDYVFIGPNAVFTNDKYPVRKKTKLKGPILRRGASLGANVILLTGIEIGEGALIAAGSVVTKDVPPWKLAIGVPAVIKELPKALKVLNRF